MAVGTERGCESRGKKEKYVNLLTERKKTVCELFEVFSSFVITAAASRLTWSGFFQFVAVGQVQSD